MLKSILILSHARTGSSFLNSHFSSSGLHYNSYEFFWQKPSHAYRHIQEIVKLNHPIPQSFLPYMNRLCDPSKPKIETIQKKDNVLNTKMYLDFYEILNSNNYDWLFTKFLWVQHKELGIDLSTIIGLSDYIIINVRKDILATWISYEKAKMTNQWHLFDEKHRRDIKILWNKTEFIEFSRNYTHVFNYYESMINNCGKYNTFKIYYETLQYGEVELYLKNIFKEELRNQDNTLDIKKQSTYKKQNTISTEADNFLNPKEFKQDYNSIRGYLKYI